MIFFFGQLKKGAKFQTLAKKYSTCPSGKKGGDLGEFKKGAMVPAFDKAVFSGKVLRADWSKLKLNLVTISLRYYTVLDFIEITHNDYTFI